MVWGRVRAVKGKALLPLSDTSALRIQLQLVELPLMELVHCRLCRQDRVEIIALPLHSMLVEVAAVLHRNELLAQENRDTVNHGVSC